MHKKEESHDKKKNKGVMPKEQQEEILLVLSQTLQAIESDDVRKIRDASNRIIDSASIFQDEDTITTTVVIYSLSKIFERSDYRKFKDWNFFYQNTVNNLKDAYLQLKNNHFPEYRKSIQKLIKGINKLSTKLKTYIKEVMAKANISKGSRLHEHGISLGRTAELTGVTKWDLMDYVGKTGISDVKENIDIPVSKRLKKARSLFK